MRHRLIPVKIVRAIDFIAACLLDGCSSLPPRGSSDTRSTFDSFEDTRATAEKVVALQILPSELGMAAVSRRFPIRKSSGAWRLNQPGTANASRRDPDAAAASFASSGRTGGGRAASGWTF
jgi:hypothetical protein